MPKKPRNQARNQETKKPRNHKREKLSNRQLFIVFVPLMQKTKKPRSQETHKPRNQKNKNPRNHETISGEKTINKRPITIFVLFSFTPKKPGSQARNQETKKPRNQATGQETKKSRNHKQKRKTINKQPTTIFWCCFR